jgi:hypothetical protein
MQPAGASSRYESAAGIGYTPGHRARTISVAERFRRLKTDEQQDVINFLRGL